MTLESDWKDVGSAANLIQLVCGKVGVDAEEAAKEFQKVFELLAGSAGRARGQLNHLWIYIDRAVEKSVSIPVVYKRAS